VFENEVLMKILGPKRDEMSKQCGILHIKEPRDLCRSHSIVMVVKSKKLQWAGHVARMGYTRNAYNILVGKLNILKNNHSED
jgi:hypothetical protein